MQKHAEGVAEPESAVKDFVLTHLRCLQLQARLLLLSSAFDGFTLQAEDVRCHAVFITDVIDKIKKGLKEV